MPAGIKAGSLTKVSGKDSRILWIDDLAGLIAGVQMRTLEFHVWGSRRQTPDLVERAVFDIDPDEGLSFGHVRQAAVDIRDILDALGLNRGRSFPVARASTWWCRWCRKQTGKRSGPSVRTLQNCLPERTPRGSWRI
jgi:DNA primase